MNMNAFYAETAERVWRSVSLERLRNKSVLITGSNGLLGSHLAAAIHFGNMKVGLNTHVTCISRRGPWPWLESLSEGGRVRFVAADLTAKRGLPSFDRSFDFIIHAAGYAQPQRFLEDALGTLKLGSTVTSDLLELAADSRRPDGDPVSFLFVSSAAIYGEVQGVLSIAEDCPGVNSPLDARAAYISAKRFGETVCKVFADRGLVKARIVRPAHVFGPGLPLDDKRVLSEFIARALADGVLRMKDAGERRQHWLFISDAVTMLFHVLLHGQHVVYNVAGPEAHSIEELAQLVGKAAGVPVIAPAAVERGFHSDGASTLVGLDISRILSELRLETFVSLENGVRRCVDWARWVKREHDGQPATH